MLTVRALLFVAWLLNRLEWQVLGVAVYANRHEHRIRAVQGGDRYVIDDA